MSQADSAYTTNPSRRLFLVAGSAASVFGALHQIGGDEVNAVTLTDQFEAFKRLHAEFLTAENEVAAACERIGTLRPPGFIFAVTPGAAVTWRDGEEHLFCDPSPKNVAHLKAMIAKAERGETWINIEAAKNTVAQIDAYRAETDRRHEASGYNAAAERSDEIVDRKYDLANEIIDRAPKDFKELALQAAVTRAQFDDDADFNDIIDHLIRLAGVEDVAIA